MKTKPKFACAKNLIVDINKIVSAEILKSGEVYVVTISGHRHTATPFALDSLRQAIRNAEFDARNTGHTAFSVCTNPSAEESAQYADFNIAAFLVGDGKGNVKFCPADQVAAFGSDGAVVVSKDSRVYPTAKPENFFIGFYRSLNDARHDK